ncbi:class I SAM-dependent DNA methyltransferase [Oceanicaulis alexandrii]|uniref:class I SAM-dependent DNA methyltransferase n=1 Tax=Oceanicaulis alexandrii TaxID=153233 RepID=UPI0023524319|nr:DNA methyltransferase [Oceanicaulis alexandrii]
MNAVEIEEAVSNLAEQPFDAQEFPFAILEAFGNKATTIKRLRTGASNKSDLDGVLQTSNIHIKVCEPGTVADTLVALKDSPATKKARAKFVLATDGEWLEAEDLNSGETVACEYADFHEHFGFFLPLAGISTVQQIRESAFDIKATGRLNKLYIELLRTNPDWGTAERRHDMNHFMARLIFCFFAEHTEIFTGKNLFTSTIKLMSDRESTNTHEVISELFLAMNTKHEEREAEGIRNWATKFPYVNGGLFADSVEAPTFTKMARSYLLNIGKLDWKKVNPDIFGSMIQAVADEEERGALGMHYTSVSNILKVLNPLFLEDLRERLEEAGDNGRKLLNLRNRMAKIRVFDPACGSGNFLVIAYKEMRKIEAEINARRGEKDRRSEIPLTNFRGIELRDFPAEIARLALIIAEYQCDVLHRGQLEALKDVLPLNAMNWITRGNALQLDWLSICPPTGTGVKHHADDLFHSPIDQAEIDFENEGGETYICGNPPYLGSTWQSTEQKEDLGRIFEGRTTTWKSLDYVAGWFMKAADYGLHTPSVSAFVSTNSICQGQQVSTLWPLIFKTGHEIAFAHTSFKWANLASHNAGVTVAIVAITNIPREKKLLYSLSDAGENILKEVDKINAYLVGGKNVIVNPSDKVLGGMGKMDNGNKPVDGGHLLLEPDEARTLNLTAENSAQFVRRYVGSQEAINGKLRYCLWITDEARERAETIPAINSRIRLVRDERLKSAKKMTRDTAARPHAFQQVRQTGEETLIVVPRVSSENRDYLPCVLMEPGAIMSDKVFALYDAPLWNMALIASRLHWVWIGTVCVRMRTDFSYSNTLGWNTFPVPKLTEKNKEDLTRCAEDILLAREAHFPATIADLYDPEKTPADLRAAHDRNDEVLERIYIGRRFKNDTERLEKLFELYTKMTQAKGAA